jgi:Na+-translocating ferredoxin:NAD+ oxidoreductase RnfA subunit
MSILTLLLVIAVFVLIAWLVQRFIENPAKTIVLVALALILVIYLFRVFGLSEVRV